MGEAENLNLNWLVYGTGPRHRVLSFINPGEFNTGIENILKESWSRAFIVICQSRCALMTERQKQVKYKNRDVSFRQTGCLLGPGNAKLQSIVRAGSIQCVEFPTFRFEELEAGELGSYFLFGNSQVRGYLEELEARDSNWLLGDMPFAGSHSEIDLACLINCYNKIESLKRNTGQVLNKEKTAELTWVMYQTEMVEQQQTAAAQLSSSSSEDLANGEL
ncbi:MAG: hypothetical protein CMQ20_10010 [Gammaproteobacteria bacterium]|jgi:hypothetical protein|nr:hypothetical protein [Gammaproteobacteria bacterium]|tara:strand:+ start:340 stop:996 length:657 start_codon:yes stop_codon:yes gene_type:complete